ncbi:hypothetical protein GCM10027595_05800 [Corynebacterium nasicanis]
MSIRAASKLRNSSIGILITLSLLPSCAMLHRDPLTLHLKTVAEETDSFPATTLVDISDLYGPSWEEYAVVCPYTTDEMISTSLDVAEPPTPSLTMQDRYNRLLLRSQAGEIRWVAFSRQEVDLCPPSLEENLVLHSSSDVITFTLSNVGEAWTASEISD